MMPDKKYHLLYSFDAKPEGVRQKDLDTEQHGACDAAVLLSICYSAKKGYEADSTMVQLSLDGRTDKPLPIEEVWNAWMILAGMLSETAGLTSDKRQICATVASMVQGTVGLA